MRITTSIGTLYRFHYSDDVGAIVRTLKMECASDAEAIQQASNSMKESYTGLQIFRGERLVYRHECPKGPKDRPHARAPFGVEPS